MGIQAITAFQPSKVIAQPDETPMLLLAHQTLKRPLQLRGAVLESQYQVGQHYVLFITEGNPFEEALYIYYLDEALQVLDGVSLSAMYAAGIVENVTVIGADQIAFSFFDKNEQWLLDIFSKPRFALWLNRYPARKMYSVLHPRWLRLRKG